ncbi:hypothetical protein BDR07DRAFT_1373056 [Suillus spraguei]|nr:hypothetical protein BDR07DRAFT_1373056 [Suillus spraguei]
MYTDHFSSCSMALLMRTVTFTWSCQVIKCIPLIRQSYHPGWDCHGLPIENKALQELKARSSFLLKDALSLPPNVIRAAAKATAEREMKTQQEEFEQFCILADWSPQTTFRTLVSFRVFQQMVEQGLIYRHYRPVDYSPSSHSALAEAELVYNDEHLHLSGSANAKIIAASYVTSESGSGLVHCAPAHGAEDYLVFRGLGLLQGPTDIICHVDGAGKFSSDVAHVVGEEAAQMLVGQEVLKDGSKAIIKLLESTGSLVKVQRIKHRYPYDWKTGELSLATSQWFANLDGIKDNALHALKDVQFYPPSSRNRLESFVRPRSEWCISCQRVWGVPIPALYHTPTDTAVLSSESLTHILRVVSERGVAHWWDGPVEDLLTPELLAQFEGGPDAWRKGTDTMDVWFDSGSNWSTLSAPTGGREHRADVCLEGTDQHSGWFQSQLLTSVGVSSGQSGARPDCLYADDIQSVERRAVVTTLAEVLDCMTSVMVPVLPYLAEEIHSTLHEGDETVSQLSVFTQKWTPVSAEWNDPHAEQDRTSLLRMRNVVLSLLKKAQRDKNLKSSLEAEVDIILPNDISVQPYLLQLIEREEAFLKTLFIVSNANITDEGSLGTSSFAWSYVSSMDIPDSDLELAIRVRPASLVKCPRCWTYPREEEHDLCPRCEDVVRCAD